MVVEALHQSGQGGVVKWIDAYSRHGQKVNVKINVCSNKIEGVQQRFSTCF
jgi:hypothetical protein